MAWLESDHPRKAAGAGGGQFTLAYDSASNTGTGYGKRNGDARVKAAQKALNAGGMTDGKGHRLKLDGKLGPRTTAALKKYQRAHGMSPTGKITPGLLKRLKGGKRRTLRKSAGHRTSHHKASKARPKPKAKAKTPAPKARAKATKPLKRPPTVMRTDDTSYDRPRTSSRGGTPVARLTAAKRKRLSKRSFALGGRRYPIHDASHARNALARVSQHGSPAEKAKVKAAVRRKYKKISVAGKKKPGM